MAGATPRKGDTHLPPLPSTLSAGSVVRTPEGLAAAVNSGNKLGGRNGNVLLGRLYSNMHADNTNAPNILTSAVRRDDAHAGSASRRVSATTQSAPPPHQATTTALTLPRTHGGTNASRSGPLPPQDLATPPRRRESELRDLLTSPAPSKGRDRILFSRGPRVRNPDAAVTSLSATPGRRLIPYNDLTVPYNASHRDPETTLNSTNSTNSGTPPDRSLTPGSDEPDQSSPFAFIKRALRGDPIGRFIYLTMKPVGIADPYNPYDLIAVPHKHTDHTNYFTMAKEGVTHVQNGDADFIPLDSWVHEHDIFHRMLKIPFFSQYRKWKTFVGWKKHVRQSRVAAYKAFLEENLFILNLDLCPQLLRVRSICQDLVNLELFAPVSETRTLDQFVDLQARNREVQARKLDGKVKETRDIIDEACKAAMTTSIPVSLTDSPEPPVAMDHTAKPSRSGRGPNSPVSSPTLNPSEPQARQQQTYIELSQKRAVCRRLTSFIRLCDYMVVDALVRLTLKSADEVKTTVLYPRPAEEGDEDIERHDSAGSIAMPGERTGGKSAHELALEAAGVSSGGKQKVMTSSGPFSGPVFIIEVVFVDDGLVIQPNLDSFVFKVESILKKFTETVVRVERFAQMEAFAQYTKHVTADHAAEADLAVGPDVNEMVAGEASYRALVQTIKSSLQAAFADVEDYALRYETFKAMYLENRLVDPHKIKEDDPPLDWFRDERQKYHTQQQDIDRLPAQKDVAIFTTKTDMLKQVLAPSPVRCLEELETLLPQIAKEKNDALFAEITQANTNLEHEPQTVEEFVDFIKFHSSVSARIDDINTEYSVIHDMYLLVMTDLEIRNPSVHEDHLRFTEGTGPAVNKLRTMVTQVEDTRDNLTKHFGDDIDGQHEKLRATVSSVSDRGKNPIIDDEDADMEEVIAYISQLAEEMERLKNREKELSAYQELIDPTRMGAGTDDEVMDVYRVVHDKLKLWTSLKDWLAKTEQWNGTVFEELNAADLETEVAKFDKTVKQVDRTLKGNPVVPKLRGLVDEFRLTLPVINCLKNPNLKEHHWTAIDDIVGRNLSQDPSYTLGILIDLKVMDLKEEIQQVSNQATQEQQLDEMLGTVQKRWQGVEFIVNPYKEQKDTYILGSVEDIITHLEDSSVVIATIASNRYCTGGLRRRVGVWEDDMKYMTETLDKWLEVQRKWMYLESIFSHKELQQQWPEDARSFQAVDKGFRDLMKRTAGNPGVKSSLTQNNYSLLPLCRKDIDALERIEKRLEEKLDQKRRLFPRFYFLSNDDLLDILAQIRHPERIAPHMLKMFDNIRKLTISESADVTHMISSEGEQVAFPKHFKARGPVEKWLGETEVSMVSALRRLAKACWEDYEVRPRMEWIFQHPAQLVLVISQIFWARDCAAAVLNGTLEQYLGRNNDLLRELAAATAQDLTFVSRSMLRTLITLEVHGRDLVEGMIRDGVDKTTAFGWTKQLRCYWENTDDSHGDIVIRQNNSYFVYGYEYLGAMGRLVITPLTDRVFMTISGALHLCLGTAPSGPAGTGKTESVKDLAKGLGRQCIVYNCSDGVTYKMMETFFSGLCQTGAWCCLDEFNRIGIEVLSVIASQLHEVREGLLKQKGDPSYKTFMFQGQPDIDLKSTFGTCITMNPGYAGRTELPDNLKALFRPISVMTPDFRMIAEVILFSEGFANATNLSLKITQLYKLSSEQLSAQHHYDFGMRALKSILVMAGDLKRSQPDVHEDLTLIIACNDSNIPKFVADDIPLFKGIMSDLFPGVEIPERNYDELLQALTRYMNAHSLEMVPTYVTKIFQFYETLIVRHGVMMVGATGGGKTAAREALADTLTDLAERKSTNSQARLVKQHVLNPKSISMAELYGSIDINTNEWQDGILPLVVKQCRQLNDAGGDGAFDHQWVVFDGPVDTLWVESMNSVLDDSKLLCLDNGVRIRLPDTIHMAFEVADLAVASPATVSRCGMVYMDFAELGWTPTVYKWLKTKMKPHIGAKTKAMLEKLFHTKLKIGLKWLFRHAKQLIVGVEQNIVQSCCDLFHALVETKGVKFPAEPASAEEEDEAVERDRKELCGVLFAFSYVWSVGGNVDDKSRLEFDTACREALEDVIAFNGPNSVFDFQVDIKTRSFTTWESSVPDFQYDASVPYFDILVPTIDTYRYSFLLKTLLQCKKPVLFSGHSGTGKSIIVQQTLRVNAEELHLVPVIIQFSAKTSAPRTQEMMESKLKAKRKNLLGGPTVDGVQKTVALFIDDLNMPALEQFGASPPVELVRQTIGNGGFYDRKYLFWKTVQDVVVLAACGPPEGGRSAVTPRVVRFFHLLQIPNLSEEAMVKIFQSILNGFFSASTFMPEVKEIVKPMVEASVDVYNTIREALRPRPAKAHYTFNLRDLSKVFQGIIQVVPRTCTSSQQAVRLWVHENSRCYYDRLVSNEDRTYFVEEVMGPTLLRKFPIAQKMNIPELFEEPVIWGDFLKPSVPVEERLYEECTDLRKLPRIFEEYLDDYNLNTQKTMNLVFFGDHCYHLSRITRIIRQPRGNALLVGVGGSGKQSLTRLAASIADYQVFQIEVNSKYSLDKFHEDLLILYQIAGIDRRPVVFLFNDSQIVDEGMVEDVNNMLNSGEVPSLFTVEERDKKINQSMEAAREAGQAATRDDIYSFFIARVRDNLHIVLGMSPVGDAFRTRCRNFPSLTNCCSVDWFDEWPTDALYQVASRQFSPDGTEFDFEVFGKELDLPSKLTNLCVTVHHSVSAMASRFYDELRRHYYITPTSYLDFISLYVILLEDKYKDVGEQLGKLKGGSEKMKETNEFIAVKKKEILEQKPLLEEATEKNTKLMSVLKVRTEKANAVRVTVSAQETEASEQQKVAAVLKADAEADLAQALPQLEAAEKSLQSLDKSSINEIKSYSNPTKAVEMTMHAVMILLEEGKYEWKRAKDLLGRSDFMRLLLEYDRDNMQKHTVAKVAKFCNDEDFTPEKIEKGGSSATKVLCIWCHAMFKYYHVNLTVEPKKQKLNKAQSDLDTTNKKLAEAQAALKTVEDELAVLQDEFSASVKEKADLEENIERSKRQLANAEVLTESLGSETERWSAQTLDLEQDMSKVPGDVFLSAASIIYFGAFTPVFRTQIVQQWMAAAKSVGVPVSDNYSLVRTLADPMQVREWQIHSLPTDNTSSENAVLCITSCESSKLARWPLMIDPQGQAAKWIRAEQAKKGLKVLKMSDPKYIQKLGQAICNGTPILIDDVAEVLDPALESVLLKQVYMIDGQPMINLGGNDHAVKYDHNFRLYLTTKMANPHYLPDVCIKVTLINFTVTMEGLEDQMLGDVVSIVKSELEEQKSKVLKSVADAKRRKKNLENQILERLESAQGNVLDEPEIIKALKQSQSNGAVLVKQLAEAEEKEKTINSERENYRSVAKRAAILYFVVAALPAIDPMYQYSLDYIKRIVRMVISSASLDDDPHKLGDNLTLLIESVTETVYRAVCRGLFNKHKTVFQVMLCTSVMRGSGLIGSGEWQFFNRPASFIDKAHAKPSVLAFLSDTQWGLIKAVSLISESLKGLIADMQAHPKGWHEWIVQDEPQDLPLPKGSVDWNEVCSPFQRCLIIRCFREEKMFLQLIQFVDKQMGPKYVEAPAFDLKVAFEDSGVERPIMFILSQGSDPTEGFLKWANEVGRKVRYVALGQGQEGPARRLVESGKKAGDWILLQNCHLGKSFMGELQEMVAALDPSDKALKPDFRMWLTSMPAAYFPIPILQNSIKITNEAPSGLKANMNRCFADIPSAELSFFDDTGKWTDLTSGIGRSHAYKKLLYGLCFFHSIILERRKFGSLGWNVTYEWNDTDLVVSRQWLQLFLEQEDVPWDSMLYIIGEINYGGRVTDPLDRLCLASVLKTYFNTDILDDAYVFSKSGVYKAPPEADLPRYRAEIHQMPRQDAPEVFGLHQNASLRYQLQVSSELLGTLLMIQPRESSKGSGVSPEELVKKKAKEIIEMLPEPMLLEEEAGPTSLTTMPNGVPNSLSTVLRHEVEKYNRLLTHQRKTLTELEKAIAGLTVLSEALDKMYLDFLNDTVPALWSQVSYLSLKPLGAWMADLVRRVDHCRKWLKKGEPSSFWLPGLFAPHGFMTGILQGHARQHVISVDVLAFSFVILPEGEPEEKPESGVYIHGMFSDSFRWDHTDATMVDSLPGESYANLPNIHLLPRERHVCPPEAYPCPAYITTSRKGVLSSLGASTNFIMCVDVPTDLGRDFWIRKGAAMLCQLNN